MTSTLTDRRRATLERRDAPARPAAKKTATKKTATKQKKTRSRPVLRPVHLKQRPVRADRQRAELQVLVFRE